MPPSASGTEVGRVVGLWRYPVKSMGAEALTSADVTWNGFRGDRRWAFVRDDAAHGGFPWLTLRQRADLAQYRPSFSDPSRPDASPTVVRTPSGEVVDITDAALAEDLYAAGASLVRQDRGTFDAFPISLITTQTVARLAEWVGQELSPLRFRPNLLVEAISGRPFEEDEWVGWSLRIGSASMRVDERDGRCVVITIDPQTGEKEPAILRSVVAHRRGCLGVYGSTVTPGRVTLDDTVVLQSGSEEA